MAEAPRFEASVDLAGDLIVVSMSPGDRVPAAVARAIETDLAAAAKRHGMIGKWGETLMVPGGKSSVLLVGVGSDTGPKAIREAAVRAGAAGRPFRTVASILPGGGDASAAAQAFSEGFLLGAYRYDGRKSSPDPLRTATVRAVVAAPALSATRMGLKRGAITGRAENRARDLTNMASSDATPAMIADEARAVAKGLGLSCKVWTKAALEKGGFGGILAVGRGGKNEPRMVELTYDGGGRAKPIAVTGKGITFDSGGLDIKKPSHMLWMRSDMAGAAAALSTIRAVAELGLKTKVIALLPLAENMPGGNATRPGDLITHRGGITSEMIDTDAEGRVLLADALAFLAERKPRVIIDSATLTDASGLGADLFACMGTDPALVAEMIAAGEEAGEPGWQIPLWSRYRHLIDSPVADVKNLGDHDIDNSMMAGLFLRDFVGDVPWVHLDTGSSAWAEYPTGLRPGGATGVPTRAFIRFIERLAG